MCRSKVGMSFTPFHFHINYYDDCLFQMKVIKVKQTVYLSLKQNLNPGIFIPVWLLGLLQKHFSPCLWCLSPMMATRKSEICMSQTTKRDHKFTFIVLPPTCVLHSFYSPANLHIQMYAWYFMTFIHVWPLCWYTMKPIKNKPTMKF